MAWTLSHAAWIWSVAIAYLWLNQYQYTSDGVFAGSIAAWADGAAHLSYASRFAYGYIWSNQLPVYLDHPFSYPFVADAVAGLTTRLLGIPLLSSYQIWGVIFSAGALWAIARFGQLVSGSRAVAGLGLSLFLLSGGLGGLAFFEDVSRSGLVNTLSQLPRQYTHMSEAGIEMINTITAQLLPQRALLLGLVLGTTILANLYQIYVNRELPSRRRLVTLGVLLGALPMIHPHTLIFVSGFVAWVGILTLTRVGWHWAFAAIPSLVLGLWQISTFILPGMGQGQFARIELGWLPGEQGINWFWFWLNNWGLFLPLLLLVYWRMERQLQIFFAPIWLWFVLANVVVFQPYTWDNTKIFLWFHLLGSLLLALNISKLYRRGRAVSRLALSALVLVLSWSGGLDVLRQFQFEHNSIAMYAPEDLRLAEFVRANTLADAIILTGDRHTHPIPTLTGRQIVMGYRGWLWTYGIDYSTRQRQLADIYAGSEMADTWLKQLRVDLVVLGPNEADSYFVNQNYFDTNYRLVYQDGPYRLYQLK